MKPQSSVPQQANSKARSCICTALFLFIIFFVGSALIGPDYREKMSRWPVVESFQNVTFRNCKNQCRPPGSEVLPAGIVSRTTNLQMRPLWGFPKAEKKPGLLALPVGMKQRDLVNEMVEKFLSSNFAVMLFHYDGIVDEWNEFEWSDHVVHVSAQNQTKWWFAKRFLHPDIVEDYSYIFLWDEDLGVENFDPQQYLSIVRSEGLEISQPALDISKSQIHQQLTARARKSVVHRRIYKPGFCDGKSTAPPCTGWVEMMAPVFSKAAWRCVWYMIQNDLIHAWGLDYELGYCAQGDRTRNIGVVDAEYIVHYGRPTLGGTDENEISSSEEGLAGETGNTTSVGTTVKSHRRKMDPRLEVRKQSFVEFKIFQKRWKKAVAADKCWVDPYKQTVEKRS